VFPVSANVRVCCFVGYLLYINISEITEGLYRLARSTEKLTRVQQQQFFARKDAFHEVPRSIIVADSSRHDRLLQHVLTLTVDYQ